MYKYKYMYMHMYMYLYMYFSLYRYSLGLRTPGMPQGLGCWPECPPLALSSSFNHLTTQPFSSFL